MSGNLASGVIPVWMRWGYSSYFDMQKTLMEIENKSRLKVVVESLKRKPLAKPDVI